jgi:hypothetical protein
MIRDEHFNHQGYSIYQRALWNSLDTEEEQSTFIDWKVINNGMIEEFTIGVTRRMSVGTPFTDKQCKEVIKEMQEANLAIKNGTVIDKYYINTLRSRPYPLYNLIKKKDK